MKKGDLIHGSFSGISSTTPDTMILVCVKDFNINLLHKKWESESLGGGSELINPRNRFYKWLLKNDYVDYAKAHVVDFGSVHNQKPVV